MADTLETVRAWAVRRFEDAQAKGKNLHAFLDDLEGDLFDKFFDAGLDAIADKETVRLIRDLRGRIARNTAQRPAAAGPRGHAARPADRKAREPIPEDKLSGPFRFVALNDAVLPAEPECRNQPQDRPLPDGYCATLDVTWAAETPLLIGEESRETVGDTERAVAVPLRVPGGTYAIPGATLRGCLRAAMEITAAGRLGQINAHHRYGLRDFDHPHIRRGGGGPPGQELSLLDRTKVKAGWLRRLDDNRFEVTPCPDWRTIAIADLPVPNRPNNPFVWRSTWLGKPLPDRYDALGVPREGKVIRFSKARSHSFAKAQGDKPVAELVPHPKGTLRGKLVVSNRSPAAASPSKIEEAERKGGPGQPKKREYVFLEAGADTAADPVFTIKTDDPVWRRFWLINTKPAKNARDPDGSLAELIPSLDAGEAIPVFYIGDPNKDLNLDDESDSAKFQIGLTRFFKVAHKYAIGDLRDRVAAHGRAPLDDPDQFKPDFVETLFGYVYETDELYSQKLRSQQAATAPKDVARRGRVSFGFAGCCDQGVEADREAIATVMGAPRASFAPFYLAGLFKDYSAGPEEPGVPPVLAGRKRYPVRHTAATRPQARAALYEQLRQQVSRLQQAERKPVSDRIKSWLRFLIPARGRTELPFQGQIRLHNVSAAELGALLWTLMHGGDPAKPYRHQIGRAKAFGAGQMRVKALTLRVTPNRPANTALLSDPEAWELPSDPNGWEGWLTAGSRSTAPFLRAFDALIAQHRPGWPNLPDLAEFLAVCDPRVGAALAAAPPQKGRLAYPMLKDFRLIRECAKLSDRHQDPIRGRDRYLGADSLLTTGAERRPLHLPYRTEAGTPGAA